MALAYRSRRTFANAVLRALRNPSQLAALFLMLVYTAINLGVIVALVVAPIPPPMRRLLDDLLPGGVAMQLDGVRGTLVIVLLSLAASAAFENPLLQFGQADIDLLFPSPVPGWRLVLGRLLSNHLRAFAAAIFLWGLAVVPLLRLSGLQVWPEGAWALLALVFTFATVDQGFAAALIWLAGHGATRWLARAGLLAAGALLAGLLAALGARLITGSWTALAWMAGSLGQTLGTVVLPIGMAVDILLLPARHDAPWPLELALLGALDLLSGAAVLALGGRHLRELAFTALGQGGMLARAIRRSGANPIRFARMVWSPEAISTEDSSIGGGLRPFGRGAWVFAWARLAQLQRNWTRALLALTVLGAVPLAVIVINRARTFGALIAAVIFSVSLATQVFNELRDHLTSADIDLALPTPRWRLLGASLLAHLPLYWGGGLILLVGIGLTGHRANWMELALLALWQPLVALALLALRTAVMFLLPSAALPGRRDPVQYTIVALVNSVVTGGLLMLALLPVWVLAALQQIVQVSLPLIWAVLFGCGALLAVIGALALAWAYGRYEPGE